MTSWRASIVFVAVAVLAAGCDPAANRTRTGDDRVAVAPTPTPNPRLDITIPDHDQPPMPVPAPADYRFVIEAPAKVSRREPFKVTLAYTNVSASEQVHRFTSSQRWELALRDAKGEQVWLWSMDKMFMAAMGQRKVAPNQTIADELDVDWSAIELAPGDYTLVAGVGGGFAIPSTPSTIAVTD